MSARYCLACEQEFHPHSVEGVLVRFCPDCAVGPDRSRCACGCGYVCRRTEYLPGHGLKTDIELRVWTPYLREFDEFILNWRDPHREPPRSPAITHRDEPPRMQPDDPMRVLIDALF